MAVFFLIGVLFTLLVAAGGGFAWWWLGRRANASGGKRRHREEARQLQERFEADEDFARNFHRPTQNELLETLQALDHLMPDWERAEEAVVEHRFKNELAESFPTLRKERCHYPEPIAEDLARLFGNAKLSETAKETRQREHALRITRQREGFHAARAHANAMHQITSGPGVGPVELTPGSLPFVVHDDGASRAGRSWGGKLAVAAIALICLAAAGAYFVTTDPGLRKRLGDYAQGDKGVTVIPAPTVTPAPTPNAAASSGGHAPAPRAEPPVPVVVVSPTPALATGGSTAVATPAETPAPVVVAQNMFATPPPAFTPTPGLSAPSATPSLAQQIADSQQRAIDKFPDLAVPNSELNSRFVFRYKKLAEEKSARLQDPNWPEKLAEECVAAAAFKGRKISQAR